MSVSWLISNANESRGFVSKRTQMSTFSVISYLFGTAMVHNYGRTINEIPIVQILTPMDIVGQEKEAE